MADNLSDQAYAIAINNVDDELIESTRSFEDAQRQGDPVSMAYAYERMVEVKAKRDRMTGESEQQQQGGELSAAQRQFLDHRSRMGDDWSAPNRRQDYVAGHIEAVKAGWEIDSPQYFNVVKNYVERCGNGGVVLDERAAAGCPIGNGAVTSAVLVHLRVEPAHFDWRWRERPALALLAWEA